MFICTSQREKMSAISVSEHCCIAVGVVDRQKVLPTRKIAGFFRHLSFSVCAGQGAAGICTHNQYLLAMAPLIRDCKSPRRSVLLLEQLHASA
jgi:hypothetical protein